MRRSAAARRKVERNARDRVTIELRGMRERLNALAAARKMTTAALARKALGTLLDDEQSDDQIGSNDTTASDAQVVKVTLRLSAAHAAALVTRARAADVSQGAYVAGLIDGTPPNPLPPITPMRSLRSSARPINSRRWVPTSTLSCGCWCVARRRKSNAIAPASCHWPMTSEVTSHWPRCWWRK